MFYLLEDNRIVDSDMKFTKNITLWEVKDNCLFAKSKNDKLVKVYKNNQIIKQSENVFDLIENGDLIASYRYSIEGRTNEKEINSVDEIYEDENGVGINQCCIVDYDDICAIYKPDAQGNYIKVWEKKIRLEW